MAIILALLLCLGVFGSQTAGNSVGDGPMLSYVPRQQACPKHNLPLKTFLHRNLLERKTKLLPDTAKTLEEFVLEVKESLDAHMLPERAIFHLFSDAAEFHPTCSGLWMEFGVFQGSTINITSGFREKHCSPACPSVHGFDTFTGLPETWNDFFVAGAFDQAGLLPPVNPNVNLIKGLFNESLPKFLTEHATYAGDDVPVSYLHVDCDLYAGTRDIFINLASRLVVGTVIVFDELVNYEGFRDHEIKAFFEYLEYSGTKVLPIGILGPLPKWGVAVDLLGSQDAYYQSAAFVIAETGQIGHQITCNKRSRFCDQPDSLF